MPAYASTYQAAPLDRTARVTTRAVWLAAAACLVFGVAIAMLDTVGSGLVLVSLGVLLVAMQVWMRRIEPRSYDVGDGLLQVRRRSASPSTFDGAIAHVRRGSLGWRVFGDGGAYGYLGRFRAEGRTVSAYVTDRAKVVLLDVGGMALALSPDDPDEFVEVVGRGGA